MTTNSKKRKKAAVAVVTAAAILLAGTFAWTSISQTAKNEAVVDINPGARLHDDFDGINKDVYVENFGDEETGVDIYARIRLDEYMEIGQDAGEDRDNTNRRALSVVTGTNINDKSTWTTFQYGEERDYAKYWMWDMGNAESHKPYYMPTFNKNKDSLEPDINGTYEGLNTGDIVHYDDYVPYGATSSITADAVYDWDLNTEDEVADGDATVTTNESDPKDAANILKKNETHDAKQITSGATVLSMAEWKQQGSQPGPYWVYDTDGWAYWAQPIAPGETTGLLLDGIHMSRVPDDNWYYGINVIGQFVTESDRSAFTKDGETMTEDAQRLLDLVTADETVVSTADALREALAKGEDVLLSTTITNTEKESNGLNFEYNILMTEGVLSGGGLDLDEKSFVGLFLNSENNWPDAGDTASSIAVKDTTITADSTVAVYSQAIDESVTLENVDITSAYTGLYAEYGNGTTTLNNVNITSTGPDNIDGYDWYNAAVAASNGANVIINGGSYTAQDDGSAVHIFSSGGTVVINDGYFDGALKEDAGTLIIQGGTFTKDPSAFVNLDAYQVVEEDGVYVVKPLDEGGNDGFKIYCMNNGADNTKPWYNGEGYMFSGMGAGDVTWSVSGGTPEVSYGQADEYGTFHVFVGYDEPAGTEFTVTAESADGKTDTFTFTTTKIETLSLVHDGETRYSNGDTVDLTGDNASTWFYTYETANVYYEVSGSSIAEGGDSNSYFDILANSLVIGDGERGTDGKLTLTLTHRDDENLTATYYLKIE